MTRLYIKDIAAALAFLVLPARAQECPGYISFAVEQKLNEATDNKWDGTGLNARQLGDMHWRLRHIQAWAEKLPKGCVRSEWLGYLGMGLEDVATAQQNAADYAAGQAAAPYLASPPK